MLKTFGGNGQMKKFYVSIKEMRYQVIRSQCAAEKHQRSDNTIIKKRCHLYRVFMNEVVVIVVFVVRLHFTLFGIVLKNIARIKTKRNKKWELETKKKFANEDDHHHTPKPIRCADAKRNNQNSCIWQFERRCKMYCVIQLILLYTRKNDEKDSDQTS